MSLTHIKSSKTLQSQKKLKSHLKAFSQLPAKFDSPQSLETLANPSAVTNSSSLKNLELNKTKSMSYLDAVNTIADFYNKEEVGRAIGMVDSVQHRQRVLDMVLQRRQELKEMQDKFTWQKAAPSIKKLTTIYRNRIKQNPLSMTGSQFKKNIVAMYTEESQLEPGSAQFLPGDMGQSPTFSPMYKTELSFELEAGVDETPAVQRASTLNEMDVLSMFYLSKNRFLRRENAVEHASPFSLNLQGGGRTARNKNMLLSPGSQKSFGFANVKKDVLTSYREAQETARNKEVKLRLSTTHRAAKAQFVNEICNYIAKNEDNQVCQEILYNNKQAKTSLVREVESQVKTKFQTLPHLKSPAESHRTPKISPGLLSPKTRKMHENNRKFDLSPDLKTNFPMSPGPKHYPLFTEDEIKIPEEDDSFASFTELKLDNLYKETRKINRSMKTVQYGLESPSGPRAWKELEGAKKEKLLDLYRNTGEIMKITNKKLTA